MTDNLVKLEEEYYKNLEENVLQGIQHPTLLYWYQQDPVGEQPVAHSKNIKARYKICKACEKFDKVFKLCRECKCFMPIKTQFKFFSCPIGKW